MKKILANNPVNNSFKYSSIFYFVSKKVLGLILFMIPLLSQANALPPSVIKDNIETFTLNCADNPKNTTYEINQCQTTIINQLKAVENKYIEAIRARLHSEYIDDTAQLTTILADFEKENTAWDNLIDASAAATYSYWQEGTIRTLMATDRQIALQKYRIYNQWQNWLTFMDSSPAALSEPKFLDMTQTDN